MVVAGVRVGTGVCVGTGVGHSPTATSISLGHRMLWTTSNRTRVTAMTPRIIDTKALIGVIARSSRGISPKSGATNLQRL